MDQVSILEKICGCQNRPDSCFDMNFDSTQRGISVMSQSYINVIGAGLAGSEAAYQIAERGIPVKLYEMRGVKSTPQHKTDNFAELVCSNFSSWGCFDKCSLVFSRKKCVAWVLLFWNLLRRHVFLQVVRLRWIAMVSPKW